MHVRHVTCDQNECAFGSLTLVSIQLGFPEPREDSSYRFLERRCRASINNYYYGEIPSLPYLDTCIPTGIVVGGILNAIGNTEYMRIHEQGL